MFKKIFLINLIVLFVTSFTFAEVFTDINVSGNKRISKQSIVVFGNIDLKNNYSEDEINDILKNIYETGFFKEISFTYIIKNLNGINIAKATIILTKRSPKASVTQGTPDL